MLLVVPLNLGTSKRQEDLRRVDVHPALRTSLFRGTEVDRSQTPEVRPELFQEKRF